MSTVAEVNTIFPYYVSYYLNANSASNIFNFSLSMSSGSYLFTNWRYGVAPVQPTMADLQVYTLAQVTSFQQSLDNKIDLQYASFPSMTTTLATSLGNLGNLPIGSLIWLSDVGGLRCWNGTMWKTIALT